MPLTEPLRGKNLLYLLNNRVFDSVLLTQLIPITADIFVFAYPVILVIRYIMGIVRYNSKYKSDSLLVLLSVIYVTCINIGLQSIFDKARPIFAENTSVHLILNELPSASFPSDHAAVSMVFALMIMWCGYYRHNKLLTTGGIGLTIISIIMSISRVAVGVHRPTDIIAGRGVAILVVYIITRPSILAIQQQRIIQPLIKIQQTLFSYIGIK